MRALPPALAQRTQTAGSLVTLIFVKVDGSPLRTLAM
jgi:hypothetical protein